VHWSSEHSKEDSTVVANELTLPAEAMVMSATVLLIIVRLGNYASLVYIIGWCSTLNYLNVSLEVFKRKRSRIGFGLFTCLLVFDRKVILTALLQ
jgi:hypothetical protein